MDSADNTGRLLPDMVVAYYNNARGELLERVRLRDDTLRLYFTGFSIVASLAGLVISASLGQLSAIEHFTGNMIRVGSYVLLLLPVLARATVSITCQHHVLIGALERYLVVELGAETAEMGVKVRHWDASKSVMDQKSNIIHGRALGLQFLVVFSCIIFLAAFLIAQYIYGYLAPSELGALLHPAQAFRDGQAGLQRLVCGYVTIALFAISTYLTVTASFIILSAAKARERFLVDMKAFIDKTYI